MVLMVIDTSTDGWELLIPLRGTVAKQRCSEIAGYGEAHVLSKVSEATLDLSRMLTQRRGVVSHHLILPLEPQLLSLRL